MRALGLPAGEGRCEVNTFKAVFVSFGFSQCGDLHAARSFPCSRVSSPPRQACKRGNADVVRLLLEYGADCNILSKHKNTAMYFAKLSNNLLVYDLVKDHLSM